MEITVTSLSYENQMKLYAELQGQTSTTVSAML